jgi:hypothetical protein
MIAMPMVIKETMPAVKSRILCGTANRELAERICRQIDSGNWPFE